MTFPLTAAERITYYEMRGTCFFYNPLFTPGEKATQGKVLDWIAMWYLQNAAIPGPGTSLKALPESVQQRRLSSPVGSMLYDYTPGQMTMKLIEAGHKPFEASLLATDMARAIQVKVMKDRELAAEAEQGKDQAWEKERDKQLNGGLPSYSK